MDIIRYMIEAAVCSGLFLAVYKWTLAGKVSFRLCRVYIVSTMLLSVIIPAMDVPVYTVRHTWQDYVALPYSAADMNVLEEPASDNPESVPAPVVLDAEREAENGGSPVSVPAGIYAIVAVASLALLLYSSCRIARLRRRSRLTFTEEYAIAEHEDIRTPFSFLRTIFIGYNYESLEREQILAHEASHVRHRHSCERIILSVLRAFFWYNPFLWIAERYLEEVQEWEADRDVLDKGFDICTYRTTIFRQLFGYNPDISSGLNHSLTKQRFIMITKSQCGGKSWLRVAAALPAIAVVFFAFGCGTRNTEDTAPEAVTSAAELRLAMPCNPEKYANGFSEKHGGIDFVLDEGAPVYAAADAHGVSVTRDGRHGLMVTLTHADGYETRYEHLSEVNIISRFIVERPGKQPAEYYYIDSEGDKSDWTITGEVNQGQLIGYAGSTGRSTGPHLHFEVRKDGKAVDPQPLFASDRPVEAPVKLYVIEGTGRPGEKYLAYCGGKLCRIDEVGETLARNMDSSTTLVRLYASPQIPMGIITDIKEQLRTMKGLRLVYVLDGTAVSPPPAPETRYDDFYRVETLKTDMKDIINIRTNGNDRHLIGDWPGELDAGSAEKVRSWILNEDNSPALPHTVRQDFILPDGSTFSYPVSRAMILLRSDRATTFRTYIDVHAFVRTVYDGLRNDLSAKVFGKGFAALSEAEADIIRNAVPMNVCEMPPRDVRALPLH